MTLHTHNWRQLNRYSKYEWRCTHAVRVDRYRGFLYGSELRPECNRECVVPHEHYRETGCLGALVYWPRERVYVFCSPGSPLVELHGMPELLLIDNEYLSREASFIQSMRRIAA